MLKNESDISIIIAQKKDNKAPSQIKVSVIRFQTRLKQKLIIIIGSIPFYSSKKKYTHQNNTSPYLKNYIKKGGIILYLCISLYLTLLYFWVTVQDKNETFSQQKVKWLYERIDKHDFQTHKEKSYCFKCKKKNQQQIIISEHFDMAIY